MRRKGSGREAEVMDRRKKWTEKVQDGREI